MITPGTLCFLVHCGPPFFGRVVEVVSLPFETSSEDGEGREWRQRVEAAWVEELWPGHECWAKPEHLMPISRPLPDVHERVRQSLRR